MTNNPVVFGGVIQALLIAVLGVVVAMGWFPLTDNQIAAWMALIVAAVGVLTWWVNGRTVATSQLESTDGYPVTGASVRGGQVVTYKVKGK